MRASFLFYVVVFVFVGCASFQGSFSTTDGIYDDDTVVIEKNEKKYKYKRASFRNKSFPSLYQSKRMGDSSRYQYQKSNINNRPRNRVYDPWLSPRMNHYFYSRFYNFPFYNRHWYYNDAIWWDDMFYYGYDNLFWNMGFGYSPWTNFFWGLSPWWGGWYDPYFYYGINLFYVDHTYDDNYDIRGSTENYRPRDYENTYSRTYPRDNYKENYNVGRREPYPQNYNSSNQTNYSQPSYNSSGRGSGVRSASDGYSSGGRGR